MVFEQILDSDKVKTNAIHVFLLGILYVIISYFVSSYFFEKYVSVVVLFTCTLLLVPSITVILNMEEKIESKEGIKHFFHNHKDIFKIYFALFKGIFFAFLLLGIWFGLSAFDYQLNFLQTRGDLTSEVINDFILEDYSPRIDDALSLISQNLFVVIIAFILSLFYGAGALFLLVLNASIFATFLIYAAERVGNAFQMITLFFIHLIPELSGFLIAAIAGGIVSRAIVREKFGSQGFRNVMKDALVLLLISAALIIIAAFLEVFVTARCVKWVI